MYYIEYSNQLANQKLALGDENDAIRFWWSEGSNF